MLKIITMLTFFLFGMVAEGQVSETRTVAEFSKVEVKNAELIYMESDQNSLRIEAEDQAALAQVKTAMHGKTLKISNFGNMYDKVKVYVSARNVESFKAGSNAKISVTNQLTAQNLNVVLNSGASFNGNIVAAGKTKLTANRHTAFKGKIDTGVLEGNFYADAKVIICGTADTAKIKAGTVAVCNARNFVADTLSVDANGNSKVWIYANKIIAINVSDAARVIYNGLPERVNLNDNTLAFNKCKSDRYVSYNY
jgi:hypothetical protein